MKQIEIDPTVSKELSFENVNTRDLETKVKGQPLTFTLILFHVLGYLLLVPNVIWNLSSFYKE